MTRTLLLTCLAFVGCTRSPVAPEATPTLDAAAAVAPAPVWPTALTTGLDRIDISRTRGEEATRTAVLTLDAGGVWKMAEPHRGDADPDALAALFFVLDAPQVLDATPGEFSARTGVVSFDLQLWKGGQRLHRVRTLQVPLGASVPTYVDGRGWFTISPTEFSNKLPDPLELASAGLWVGARNKGDRLEVKGPTSYVMTATGGQWHAPGNKPSRFDLEDFAGVVTGRMAVDHPVTKDLQSLGLDPPTTTARLCIAKDCRDFRFGQAVVSGQQHFYALAPDSDPIEIHEPDWHLLVNGPFAGPRK